jgi:outer membrane protein
MKKVRLLVLLLAASFLLVPALSAQESPWLVRLRAVNIDPADESDAIPSLSVPADAITVSSKTIPEVDITYFFSKNLAAELVLTYPQKHDVEVAGTKIGTFKHLPPTLTLQYHFLPEGTVRPYVGAGVNFTLISDVDLGVPGVGELDLDSSSLGVAAGLGVDFKIGEKFFVNLDAKYVQIGSDVELASSGTKVSEVKIDPYLIGAGIGYRF